MPALLLLLALAAGDPAPGAPASQGPRVVVGCDAPTGHQCGYAVFYDNGARGPTFSIPGGSRLVLPDIAPGFDHYVVVVDGAPPQTMDCAGELARGHFCKVALFSAGYND